MNKLVEGWKMFCENNASFEDGYFYTLLTENLTQEEIDIIFFTFPYQEKLKYNLKQFKNHSSLGKNNLESLVLDFEEKSKIIDKYQLNYSVKTLKLEKVNDENQINNYILDDVFSQMFHDFLRSKKISTDRKYFELYNAFYCISQDFDLSMYLFSPLLDLEYDLYNLFKFKINGGKYAVINDKLYYWTLN